MEPRPESRINSLESRASKLEAAVGELSSDTAEDFKALRQDIKALGEHVDEGFRQAHRYVMDEVASKADLDAMEMRVDKKLHSVDERLDRIEQEHGAMLREILARLPEKGE